MRINKVKGSKEREEIGRGRGRGRDRDRKGGEGRREMHLRMCVYMLEGDVRVWE